MKLNRSGFGFWHSILPLRFLRKLTFIYFLVCLTANLGFRLVSPSRLAVITLHFPWREEVDRRRRSQGNFSLFFTATMSPTFRFLLFTLSNLPCLTTRTSVLFMVRSLWWRRKSS